MQWLTGSKGMRDQLGSRLPQFTAEEKALVQNSNDFYGMFQRLRCDYRYSTALQHCILSLILVDIRHEHLYRKSSSSCSMADLTDRGRRITSKRTGIILQRRMTTAAT